MTTAVPSANFVAIAATDTSTLTDDTSVRGVVGSIGGSDNDSDSDSDSDSDGNDDQEWIIHGCGGRRRGRITVDKLGIFDVGDGWIKSSQLWYINSGNPDFVQRW